MGAILLPNHHRWECFNDWKVMLSGGERASVESNLIRSAELDRLAKVCQAGRSQATAQEKVSWWRLVGRK